MTSLITAVLLRAFTLLSFDSNLGPWLGVISGITIAGLGTFMLRKILTAAAIDHSHAIGKPHSPRHPRGVSKNAVHLKRYLPLISSGFMVVVGIGIAASFILSYAPSFTIGTKSKLVPFITIILLGIFLGIRHSTDPDHVIAVSTIVSRYKSIKHSAIIGMLWGLGHSLTIFLVGSAIICFGLVIPPRLGLSMEFSVALMLILLGILNLTGTLQWMTERFTPRSGNISVEENNTDVALDPGPNAGGVSSIPHRSFADSWFHRTVGKLGLYQSLRPFVVGLVHGLAGSAAVALLVLSTIRSPVWAAAYLLVFGAGTMLGMMVMTTAIAMPMAYTGKKFLNANRYMTATSGVLSMAFGLFLVYHIGLVDGLFSAQARWIPQ